MARSHPPTLLTLTAATIRKEHLFQRGSSVLVAVSGGPDSMALLHVLARLGPRLGIALHAHGIDHGLRPEARAELDLAEALASSLAVPFSRSELHVATGGNIQARARTARYEALGRAAIESHASAIATAHHADDRAETVLLRLLRGAGPRGLAVLPPRAPLPGSTEIELVRPFIHARRAAIEAHLARQAIAFARDPSNESPRFARTRVRRELLPLLSELSPGIVEHLCSLADQLLPFREAEVGEEKRPALSRATQLALAEMVRARSTRARVSLPGGLVARYDRTNVEVVVSSEESSEASSPERRTRRKRGESAR